MTDLTPLPAVSSMSAGRRISATDNASLPPKARLSLGKRAKAAVIVRLLLNEGADIPLEDLPDDSQAALTQQMGQMRLIDRDTLQATVAEFADELAGLGLTFPNGIAGALNALDGRISEHTAKRLRKEAGVRQAGDPWDRIKAQDLDSLQRLAESECTEVAAVMLSKLDTAMAAKLLGQLPGTLARRITYAVSQTNDIRPDAVDRIGLALAAQLDAKPVLAFEVEPNERVGEILNISSSVTRDDVLTGLEETDADFAQAVRKALFTFAHIRSRIDARDAQKVTRAVDQNVLVIALAYAQSDDEMAASAEFLLSNMSSRLAETLREMIEEAGKPTIKDGEEALTAVVIAARDLAERGEITLIRTAEPEGG